MGLLRDEDLTARKNVESGLRTPDHLDSLALDELSAIKDEIVEQVVGSARANYIKSGKLKAVLDLRTDNRNRLVRNARAEELIRGWLEEYDPKYRAEVRIGPDCSGNWVTFPELVVTFERNLGVR